MAKLKYTHINISHKHINECMCWNKMSTWYLRVSQITRGVAIFVTGFVFTTSTALCIFCWSQLFNTRFEFIINWFTLLCFRLLCIIFFLWSKKERKKLKYECARWLVSHLQYIKKCCTQVITTSSFLTGFCFSFSNVSVCFLSFCLYWRRTNTKLKCTRFHIHTLIWNSYWRLQNLPVS